MILISRAIFGIFVGFVVASNLASQIVDQFSGEEVVIMNVIVTLVIGICSGFFYPIMQGYICKVIWKEHTKVEQPADLELPPKEEI